ncbi:MAG: hypothetical protein ACETWK_04375 [Candidatus Aminicenantaceae bacterium]
MKVKKKYIIVFPLSFLLILFSACKRNSIEEPSPFGPSSLSILLTVSANPNVIHAGYVRQKTTITAKLEQFDGIPMSGKTLYFEIGNAAQNKVSLGYFEGNKLLESKITDPNGCASVSYYGPKAAEIISNTQVFIWVTVASTGKEFIIENTPILIIRDVPEFSLILSIFPNVIFANEVVREATTVTAQLKKLDGTPIPNQTLYFEIYDEADNKINLGYFEGHQLIAAKKTDSNGIASVIYYGPIAEEIIGNTQIYIWVTLAASGNEFVTAKAPILIIKEVLDVVLNVFISPNVIYASDSRGIATVTAHLTKANGAPIPNQDLFFEIYDDTDTKVNIGFFEGNKQVEIKTTDQNGIAEAVYYGPLASEITSNRTIYIWVTLSSGGTTFVTTKAPIQIIRETP